MPPQNGASVDACNTSGYTALSYAVRQGHQFVVQLLLENDADITVRWGSKTPPTPRPLTIHVPPSTAGRMSMATRH